MSELYCAKHNLLGDLAILRHIKTEKEIAEWEEVLRELIEPDCSYTDMAEEYDYISTEPLSLKELMDIVEENYATNEVRNLLPDTKDGADNILDSIQWTIDKLQEIVEKVKALKAKGNLLPPAEFNAYMEQTYGEE